MVPGARGYGGFVPPHPHATEGIPRDDSFPSRGDGRYPRAPGSDVPSEGFPLRPAPVDGFAPAPREHLAVPPAADEHAAECGNVDEFQTFHRPRVFVRVAARVSTLRPPPLRRRRRGERALRRHRAGVRARVHRRVVVQTTRRRAVRGTRGSTRGERSGGCRFEPRRGRGRRASRGEMANPEMIAVGGGAPRATRRGRRREAPRRKRAKHQVQHVAGKVERRGRAGIRTSPVRIPRRRSRGRRGGRPGSRGRGRRGTPRTHRRRRYRLITLGRDGDHHGRASRRGTIRSRRRRRRRQQRRGSSGGGSATRRREGRRRRRRPRRFRGFGDARGDRRGRSRRRERSRSIDRRWGRGRGRAPPRVDRSRRRRRRPPGGAGFGFGRESYRRGAPSKTKRRRRRRSFHRARQRGEGRRRARAESPYGGRHPRRRARTRTAQGRHPGSNPAVVGGGSARRRPLRQASRGGPPTTTGRVRVGDRRGRHRRHLRGRVATVHIATVRVRARVDDGSRHRPEARGGGPRARRRIGRVARSPRARDRAGGFLAKRRDDVSYSTSASTRLGNVGTRHGLGRGRRAGGRWVVRRRRGERRRGDGCGVVDCGSVRERRRATRARARGGGDGRGLDHDRGWFLRWGARPAMRRPVRALARARAVLGGLACGCPEGSRRGGRVRRTGDGERGPGGARAGAGEGRTSRAPEHGRGAARAARGAPRAHPRPRTDPDLAARRINPRVGTSTPTGRATRLRSGKATGWARDRDARPRGFLGDARA